MYTITELEAVNDILAAAGEDPITTLSGLSPYEEAQKIRNEIDRVVREVCAEGWSFNSDPNYELTQNVDGEIQVPSQVMRIERWKNSGYVVRAGKVYDLSESSFVIGNDIEVYAILYLSFDDLPYHAQWYITKRAGRRYLTRFDSPNMEGWSIQDERDARDEFAWSEMEVSSLSSITDRSMRRISYRRNIGQDYM
jgi:hypothetical protein